MTAVHCLRTAAAAALLAAAGLPASAHPHVFSELASDVVFDDQGRIAAINVEWVFDENYTQLAIDGMDADNDGTTTAAELRPVVTENIAALKEYRYFLSAQTDGKDIEYADVTEYGMRLADDGRLQMYFVVPFAAPVDPRRTQVSYKIYDPDFYIAYDYPKNATVGVIGTLPTGCAVALGTIAFDEEVEQTQAMLAEKPADWKPEQPQDFGSLFAQPASINCKPAGS